MDSPDRCCDNHNPLTVDVRHCYIHHVDEGWSVNSFRGCGECGHVYATREELEDEYLQTATDMNPAYWGMVVRKPAEEIYFCPLCLHDF